MNAKSIAFILIFLIIAVEFALRFGLGLGQPPLVERHDTIEYQLIPSSEYYRFGNRVTINEYRMRSSSFELQPLAQEWRILLIGDSVVYGNHDLDQQEIIATKLRQRLTQHYPNCHITVAAVAASSWGPMNQLAFLNEYGLYNADTAVLILSSHDIVDLPTFDSSLFPYRLAPSPLAIHDFLTALADKFKQQPPLIQSFEAAAEQSEAAIADILKRAQQEQIQSYVFFHPTLNETIHLNPDTKSVISRYQNIAKAYNSEFINPISAYQMALQDDRSVHHDHIHPSKNGTSVISEILQQTLMTHAPPKCTK